MDAIALLTRDHRTVEQLFRQHTSASLSRKAGIYERIRAELEVHAQIEERIFYRAVRRAPDAKAREQVGEAVQEHREVKSLLRSMNGLQAGNADYEAGFRKLVEGVRHHVKEEQDEMFPQARLLLGDKRLRELGREMTALKQTLSLGGAAPRVMQAVGRAAGALRNLIRSRPDEAASRRSGTRKAGSRKTGARKAGARKTDARKPAARTAASRTAASRKRRSSKAGSRAAAARSRSRGPSRAASSRRRSAR